MGYQGLIGMNAIFCEFFFSIVFGWKFTVCEFVIEYLNRSFQALQLLTKLSLPLVTLSYSYMEGVVLCCVKEIQGMELSIRQSSNR